MRALAAKAGNLLKAVLYQGELLRGDTAGIENGLWARSAAWPVIAWPSPIGIVRDP
jgi:hypothetical protein